MGGIEEYLYAVLEDHHLGDFSWVTVDEFLQVSRAYLQHGGYVTQEKKGLYYNPVTGAAVRILKEDINGHGRHPPHGHLEVPSQGINVHLLMSDSKDVPIGMLKRNVYGTLDQMMGYR